MLSGASCGEKETSDFTDEHHTHVHSDAKPIRSDRNPQTQPKRRFTLTHRHMAVIMSTAYGTSSRRLLMIPKLAEELAAGKDQNGDIYEAFLKTSKHIEDHAEDQIPVFFSTLSKKLCLGHMFNPYFNTQN